MIDEIKLIIREWIKQIDSKNIRLEEYVILPNFISSSEAIVTCIVKADAVTPKICEEIVLKVQTEFNLPKESLSWILSDSKITYKENWLSPKKHAKSFLLHIKNLD